MSLSLLLLGALAFAGPEMIPDEPVDLVGHTAPDFEALTEEDQPFNLESTRGKPVILAFWASWCGPCRQELPALSKYAAEHPEVQIFAVNVDRERQKAAQFMARSPFSLPILWDNQAIALGHYEVTSMPSTYLIDAQGTVKWHHVGYSSTKGLAELEAAVEAL